MQNINIAIVGAGLVGQRHADALLRTPNAQLSAIVDPGDEAKQFANQNHVPYFDKLDELLESMRPDGVILSTPTGLHAEQSLTCIAKKIPLLIEKPITVTSDEAIQIVKASEQNGTPTLVGHHRRYNPLIQRGKKAIDDGLLGPISTINSTCWFYKPNSYFDTAPWRKQKGAGPISVNLVHDVDLMRYLCGDIVRVTAIARPSIRNFENEDVAAAVLEFENGAVGTISVSDTTVSPWSWEHTSGEYPVYPKTDQICYQIGGTKGALSIPDLKLWTHEAEPDWWSPITFDELSYVASNPLDAQIAHFCDVIRGTAEPMISAREGMQSLKVVEAIQEAANSKEKINVTKNI